MDLLSVSTQQLCFSLFSAKDSRNDSGAKIDFFQDAAYTRYSIAFLKIHFLIIAMNLLKGI